MVATRTSPATGTPTNPTGSAATSRRSTLASAAGSKATSVARWPNAAPVRPTLTPLPPAVTRARDGRSTLPGRSSGSRTMRSTAMLGVAMSTCPPHRRASAPEGRVPVGRQRGGRPLHGDLVDPGAAVAAQYPVQGLQPRSRTADRRTAALRREVAHRVAPDGTSGDVPAGPRPRGDLHLHHEVVEPGALAEQHPRRVDRRVPLACRGPGRGPLGAQADRAGELHLEDVRPEGAELCRRRDDGLRAAPGGRPIPRILVPDRVPARSHHPR